MLLVKPVSKRERLRFAPWIMVADWLGQPLSKERRSLVTEICTRAQVLWIVVLRRYITIVWRIKQFLIAFSDKSQTRFLLAYNKPSGVVLGMLDQIQKNACIGLSRSSEVRKITSQMTRNFWSRSWLSKTYVLKSTNFYGESSLSPQY